MTGTDIDRGCTPSPACAGTVDAVGLALSGVVGRLGSSGEARSMSVNGLSL